MVEFRNNIELKKVDMELKIILFDYDLPIILRDIEVSNNSQLIKKHFDRLNSLLEAYDELMLLDIKLDSSFDRRYVQKLTQLLFNRYCKLV